MRKLLTGFVEIASGKIKETRTQHSLEQIHHCLLAFAALFLFKCLLQPVQQ